MPKPVSAYEDIHPVRSQSQGKWLPEESILYNRVDSSCQAFSASPLSEEYWLPRTSHPAPYSEPLQPLSFTLLPQVSLVPFWLHGLIPSWFPGALFASSLFSSTLVPPSSPPSPFTATFSLDPSRCLWLSSSLYL